MSLLWILRLECLIRRYVETPWQPHAHPEPANGPSTTAQVVRRDQRTYHVLVESPGAPATRSTSHFVAPCERHRRSARGVLQVCRRNPAGLTGLWWARRRSARRLLQESRRITISTSWTARATRLWHNPQPQPRQPTQPRRLVQPHCRHQSRRLHQHQCRRRRHHQCRHQLQPRSRCCTDTSTHSTSDSAPTRRKSWTISNHTCTLSCDGVSRRGFNDPFARQHNFQLRWAPLKPEWWSCSLTELWTKFGETAME